MTTRHCAGVTREAEGLDGGSQCEHTGAKDRDVEVTELWIGRQVSAGARDETKHDRTDGDPHAHGELHHGREKSVGARHALRWNLSVGERGHAGEFEGARSTVEEEESSDERRWCVRRKGGAERD